MRKKIAGWFFLIFIFALPLNIRALIYSSPLTSVKLDFSSFFLYPAEFLLLMAFIVSMSDITFGTTKKQSPWTNGMIILLVLSLLPAYWHAPDAFLSILYSMHLLEIILIIYLLLRRLVSLKSVVLALSLGLVLQSCIAVAQYYVHGSIGIPWLGESMFNLHTINTAKTTVWGILDIRSYGTFPHPNILGGALMIGLLLMMMVSPHTWGKIPRGFLHGIGLLMLVGLFFTFSRSALLGLLAGGTTLFLLKRGRQYAALTLVSMMASLLALSLFFPISIGRFQESGTENATRWEQYRASIPEIVRYPWGTGVGNYLIVQERDHPQQQEYWQLQPVHNTLLQVSLEMGILPGLIITGWLIFLGWRVYRSTQKEFLAILVAISIPLLTDHYFYTSFQGNMLLAIVLGVVLQASTRETFPQRNSTLPAQSALAPFKV